MKRPKGIPERIAFYRSEAGISQAELARSLNVTKSAVSLWESGKGGLSTKRLVEVAKAIGVNARMLLDGPEVTA